MVIDVFEANLLLLQAFHKHIVFVINTEGIVLDPFTDHISKYATGFTATGKKQLGEVVSIRTGNTWYHGVVGYSSKKGWGRNLAQAFLAGINKIKVEEGEYLSVILMSLDYNEPNAKEYIRAINLSKNKCYLFTLNEKFCSVAKREDILAIIKAYD